MYNDIERITLQKPNFIQLIILPSIRPQGLADAALNEDHLATAPRPGTSLKRPQSCIQGFCIVYDYFLSLFSQLCKLVRGPNQAVRPMSSSGRPVTGFLRPGQDRPPSQSGTADRLTTAMGD